jgi:TIR domain
MKVFLSYAQTDKTLAKRIAAGLKKEGFDVWEASSEILPGDNWADKTAKALRESQAMIVLLTPNALASENMLHEIGYAISNKSYKGRLIPVLVGSPGSVPENQIPWILQRLQTVRLPKRGKQEDGIKRIARKLLEAA